MTIVTSVFAFILVFTNETVSVKATFAGALVLVQFIRANGVIMANWVWSQATEIGNNAYFAVAHVAFVASAFLRANSVGTERVFVAQPIESEITFVQVNAHGTVGKITFIIMEIPIANKTILTFTFST